MLQPVTILRSSNMYRFIGSLVATIRRLPIFLTAITPDALDLASGMSLTTSAFSTVLSRSMNSMFILSARVLAKSTSLTSFISTTRSPNFLSFSVFCLSRTALSSSSVSKFFSSKYCPIGPFLIDTLLTSALSG